MHENRHGRTHVPLLEKSAENHLLALLRPAPPSARSTYSFRTMKPTSFLMPLKSVSSMVASVMSQGVALSPRRASQISDRRFLLLKISRNRESLLGTFRSPHRVTSLSVLYYEPQGGNKKESETEWRIFHYP